jgi:RimJ/RimL family protein N-acetyltransferase
MQTATSCTESTEYFCPSAPITARTSCEAPLCGRRRTEWRRGFVPAQVPRPASDGAWGDAGELLAWRLPRYGVKMQSFPTRRLLLRTWRESDREAFARLNADPEVMTFLPGLLDRAASDALADRIGTHLAEHGFGLWAIEVQGGEPFIGCVGLLRVGFDAAFAPAVEIGWRMARAAWGRGYASEAAQEACRIAFEELSLPALVSYTVPHNARSRAVMERLGMTYDAGGDFEHPRLPEGHALRCHVLYRLSAQQWRAQRRP